MSTTSSTKTVTATASSVGNATSRRYLSVRNLSDCLRIRVGEASITQQKGRIVEPGETVEFRMDPALGTVIYAISEGAATQADIFESFT